MGYTFRDPKGNRYLHKGKLFYRLKSDPEQLKGDDPPKYLTPKDACCRQYFSSAQQNKNSINVINYLLLKGRKNLMHQLIMFFLVFVLLVFMVGKTKGLESPN